MSLTTSQTQQSQPEAISETPAAATCPSGTPSQLAPEFESTATLYNISLYLTDASADGSAHAFDMSMEAHVTVRPGHATQCLAVRVPVQLAATLQHICIASATSLVSAATSGTSECACVCSNSTALHDAASGHPQPPAAQTCSQECSEVLRPTALGQTDELYQSSQWHLLSLPEGLSAGSAVELHWFARPRAILTSAPFKLPQCSKGVTAAAAATNASLAPCADAEQTDVIFRAGITAPRAFAPSVLEHGAQLAAFDLAVTAPDDLALLWDTPAEHSVAVAGTLSS